MRVPTVGLAEATRAEKREGRTTRGERIAERGGCAATVRQRTPTNVECPAKRVERGLNERQGAPTRDKSPSTKRRGTPTSDKRALNQCGAAATNVEPSATRGGRVLKRREDAATKDRAAPTNVERRPTAVDGIPTNVESVPTKAERTPTIVKRRPTLGERTVIDGERGRLIETLTELARPPPVRSEHHQAILSTTINN
jgi:hypothetical protein